MVRQRESTLLRKQQIVTAARDLILKYGSEQITVKKMAHEIGVSEAAIYRHFTNKGEILSFLLNDVEKTLIVKTKRKNGNRDAFYDLEQILMHQVSLIPQKEGMSFQILAEIISLGDKKLIRQAHSVIEKFINQIKSNLSKGIKEGLINPDIDIEAMAILLFGMVQGLSTIWTLSPDSLNLEKKYQYLWNLFRQSIVQN